MSYIKRLFVEKKPEYSIEARRLMADIISVLGIQALTGVRIINRYDVECPDDLSSEMLERCKDGIFSEPALDYIYEDVFKQQPTEQLFIYKYLPGQYDQRADSAMQCVLVSTGLQTVIETAKVICLSASPSLSNNELEKIKAYIINPVDSIEASNDMPEFLGVRHTIPKPVTNIDGFMEMGADDVKSMLNEFGLAMTENDLMHCVKYFREVERRNPTFAEIKVLDTYWSDHCRHTTFLTVIDSVEFGGGSYDGLIKRTYGQYLEARKEVYGDRVKDVTLMDIATLGMKLLKHKGLLQALDESEEINACSINIKVDTDNGDEDWLLMFKNETHNHPTEIEPFGGAATCLGGAIRDPLSGRAYVYQAMRVSGSADPRAAVSETLAGKLPQRKITTGAAHGFSSYGNQIGLATGQVTEIYHPGFAAKRMELGAVLGAVLKDNVRREKPERGDAVILVGGRTGRDGCGGATGSSKAHTESSIDSCGAEVQKGNPPTERKLQRLFRRADAAALIKRCNDFGAGGVSVAVGELAEGLEIDLDKVTKKYSGLDGTELAISESQERMAVVVSAGDSEEFIRLALEENLESSIVARVTDDRRLVMLHGGKRIVDISRDFLDTNGAEQHARVTVFGNKKIDLSNCGDADGFLQVISGLNSCSQKGLIEMFDSTIGAGTVLMPLGGMYELTPPLAMAAKIPVENGRTSTASLMAYGYNPDLSTLSPFHGAVCAVVDSIAKLVASGGSLVGSYLSFQEYFERLTDNPMKWQKPFSALLGAFYAQSRLGVASIGGKDSMSGSFEDIDVPPVLVSFAVNTAKIDNIISPEFKKEGSRIIRLNTVYDADDLPDLDVFKKNCSKLTELVHCGTVISAHTIGIGGTAAALAKMAFGNKIGFDISSDDLYSERYGSFLLEISNWDDAVEACLTGFDYEALGTTGNNKLILNGTVFEMETALAAWESPLESVFATGYRQNDANTAEYAAYESYERQVRQIRQAEQAEHQGIDTEVQKRGAKSGVRPKLRIARPRVFIPVFPGTNCEDDMRRRFEEAGGEVQVLVVKNLNADMFKDSVSEIVKSIENSQIIAIPGGFSAGDEPEGSAKFIAAVFRNQYVDEAVKELLTNRDGLMLGICNGFQALMKLGLITDIPSAALTYNSIGRHVSRFVRTKIVSNKSPWLWNTRNGDIHMIPASNGEGRFVINDGDIEKLIKNGQIATQYIDENCRPSPHIPYNPNNSAYAIEGVTSPDGRVFGKMGHSERIGSGLYRNVYDANFELNTDQKIFVSGVEYFQ